MSNLKPKNNSLCLELSSDLWRLSPTTDRSRLYIPCTEQLQPRSGWLLNDLLRRRTQDCYGGVRSPQMIINWEPLQQFLTNCWRREEQLVWSKYCHDWSLLSGDTVSEERTLVSLESLVTVSWRKSVITTDNAISDCDKSTISLYCINTGVFWLMTFIFKTIRTNIEPSFCPQE